MAKIYTKTGDRGETGLWGGKRVAKDDEIIEAIGSVDELNAILGLALTEVRGPFVGEVLKKMQQELFAVGADLATPLGNNEEKLAIPRVSTSFITHAEEIIDHLQAQLPELRNFILPGGSKSAALLHVARTICRRAERRVVHLSRLVPLNPQLLIYLNRLSDLLFVLARYENQQTGMVEVKWENPPTNG